MRLMLLTLFLMSVGCGRPVTGPTEKSPAPTPEAQPLDRDQITKNLVTHAEEIRVSANSENYERIVDLTHPGVVREMGGRAKLLNTVREGMSQLKAADLRLAPTTVREPLGVFESNGKWYGVVPFNSAMIGPDGEREEIDSNLFGESTDGGRTWTFVDGEGIEGDRAKLKLVMPDFPDSLPVPASK